MDEAFQLGGTLLRGDAAQEGEHDGLIHLKEGIRLAQLAVHQQVQLLVQQDAHDGEVHIAPEKPLFHSRLEELYRRLREAAVSGLHLLVGAGIFL